MNYYLAQLILAARNRDSDGWTNILSIVVLAIFWAVVGIVKAKANKASRVDENDTPPDRQRSLIGRPDRAATPAQRAKTAAVRPIVHKPPAHPRMQPKQFAPAAAAEKNRRPEIRRLKGLKDEPLVTATGQAIEPERFIDSESLFKLDDPDELKRAILHHEILGKPLSLRYPV